MLEVKDHRGSANNVPLMVDFHNKSVESALGGFDGLRYRTLLLIQTPSDDDKPPPS
jgi:hypothetical protein